MRIRKVEILGFKSFCDKTILMFDQPITGVVGPNGCGKSNVVDAIRWCMGEQSAKQLRGKSMEDIIFNGSESRGPMGMAEVSLTFLNDDGQVPLAFQAYAEIVITRRLYRDGESEYLINKVPCRLRDVVDLFLGTGVSSKAYSIIEQGRIGFVVSSKPEDRRHLIEEAAGITKYKHLRQAAERKMELTRQNLLRLTDVCNEMEQRLGSLRRQAQKAERYKRYKGEMKDLDLWGATHRYLGFMAEDRVLRAALEQAATRQGEVASDLERRELLLEQRRLEAAQEERRLAGLQEKLYEVDNTIKLTESSAEFHAREAGELEQRGQAATREIEVIDQQSAELTAAMERARTDARSHEEDCTTEIAKLGEAEAGYRALREELSAVQSQVDRAKAEHANLGARAARDENHAEGLQRRVTDLDGRLARLTEEAEKLAARWDVVHAETTSLNTTLGGLKQMRLAIGQRKEEHEARLKDLRDRVQRGEVELETLRTELHRRRSRLTSLQEIAQRYEGFQRGVRAIMQHRDAPRDGVRALVADIIDAPADYEAAAEAVLGERLGNIIVADHEVGLRAIEFLKSRAEGRSSFIPLAVRLGATQPALPAPRAAAGRPGGGHFEVELGDAEVAGEGLAAVGETRVVSLAAAAETGVPSALAASERARFAEVIRRVAEERGDHDEELSDQVRAVTRELGAEARGLSLSGPGVRGRLIDLCGYDHDYEQVAEFLLGDVVVVEDLDTALALWRELDGAGPTLVTLDGEVVDPHGVVTGGSRERSGAGVLQQKREMRELEEIIVGLERDLEQTLARHVACKTDLAQTAQALEELKRDSHSGEMDILTHEKDLGRGRQELEQLASRRHRTEDERGELDAAKDEAAREREQTVVRLAEARERLAVLTADLARLGGAGQELLGRVDAAAARTTELKVRVAMVQEWREAAHAQLGRLEAQAREHAARRERLGRQSAEGVDRAAALRTQV
ncbi:MAG TPA: chromosome segregation protein SMC, partial [Polyangia bacterium]